MRALNDCIKEDKSKADKMFEKLGYMKLLIGNNIKYFKDDDNVYHFLTNDKAYYKSGEYDGMCGDTTMEELQAIYEKCKELGWLDKER